jgi:hypothetical protein
MLIKVGTILRHSTQIRKVVRGSKILGIIFVRSSIPTKGIKNILFYPKQHSWKKFQQQTVREMECGKPNYKLLGKE